MKIKMPALILPAILLLLSACASYRPTDATVAPMSEREARNIVIAGLKQFGYTQAYAVPDRIILGTVDGWTTQSPPIMLRDLSIVQSASNRNLITLSGHQLYIAANPRGFVDALYILKKAAVQRSEEDAVFEAMFRESLADFKEKASSGAELPEEALRYKSQAEGAIKDKAFSEAEDLYRRALRAAPWWAAGHYNRALVLGELEDYALARAEMRYYLRLLPDAENARAAQNKIYDWERLESK